MLRRSTILILFVPYLTIAQVPSTMSFQGLLTDTTGTPKNGSFEMTFSLHTLITGGTEVWSETQPLVEVVDGVFAVMLGSVTPLDSSDFAVPLFLEIEVDGELIGDRVRLATVPYAFRVANLCQPGDYLNCYTGPGGTLGVGECSGGIRSCAAGGSSFGTCVGEVTPVAEVCSNALDENCDGEPDDGCCSQIDTEPNDSEEWAWRLSSKSDCDESSLKTGTLDLASDVDWFVFAAVDNPSPSCAFEPTFSVTSGTGVEVCAYFQCVFGSGENVTCNTGSSSTSGAGFPGCCGAVVDASLDCIGTTDEGADVFMAVSPTASASCDNYSLTYGL